MGRSARLYRRPLNWADLPEEVVRPGVRRRAYATDDVMLVMNMVSPGMELNPHTHDDFDQLAVVLSGRAHYYIDDVAYEMTSGSMLLVPAGAPHYIQPLDSEDGEVANLDIFVPPRADLGHLVEYVAELGEQSREVSR